MLIMEVETGAIRAMVNLKRDNYGRYLENFQLEPDIIIYNDPAGVIRGEDKQLEAAVAEMLKVK